jgi:hypothetical protein
MISLPAWFAFDLHRAGSSPVALFQEARNSPHLIILLFSDQRKRWRAGGERHTYHFRIVIYEQAPSSACGTLSKSKR